MPNQPSLAGNIWYSSGFCNNHNEGGSEGETSGSARRRHFEVQSGYHAKGHKEDMMTRMPSFLLKNDWHFPFPLILIQFLFYGQ